MCDDDENDYKAYERMHSNRNSYYSPEYEHRMGREKGYDYEARSYQYPYSRYDREELDRDSKRYREDDRERMEREREMQNKIDTLRDEKNALQSSALLQQQTSNIVSQIRPCPVPAYLTCNPYGCNGGFGYGYPYGYNEGGCCA